MSVAQQPRPTSRFLWYLIPPETPDGDHQGQLYGVIADHDARFTDNLLPSVTILCSFRISLHHVCIYAAAITHLNQLSCCVHCLPCLGNSICSLAALCAHYPVTRAESRRLDNLAEFGELNDRY